MKKNLSTFALFGFAALLLTTVGCKSPLDKVGPDICPTKDFNITSDDIKIEGLNAQSQVDLSTGGIKIKIDFGQKLPWDLKISSNSAQRDYSGTGDTVEIFWYGNANNLPLFSEGEVTIEVEVPCRETVKKTFTVTGAPNFANLDPKYGMLIRDWDQNGILPVFTLDTPTAGSDGYFYGGGMKHFRYEDTVPSPMGGKYLKLEGETTEADGTWYFGANEIFNAGPTFANLPTKNADSLYFNIFVRKGLNDQNTGLQLNFLSNGENFKYLRDITWEGWKCISFKMSEFVVGGSNPLKVTDNLTSLGLNLGAQPLKAKKAEVNFDFILITVGEPFLKN